MLHLLGLRRLHHHPQQGLGPAGAHQHPAAAGHRRLGALHRLAQRLAGLPADAALAITREAIQLHGAIGFTDEYDAGLYLKRAMTLASWLGGATLHRRRYAELMPVEAL